MINIIVAATNDMVIGKDNDLPWKISKDLQYFKEKTSGHTVVMGRKCYESIGRPLPNRKNIILTRNTEYSVEGCEVLHDIDDILKLEEDVFIIGGSEIYKEFLPFCDKLYFTQIFNSIEGDTYFDVDLSKWVITKATSVHTENDYSFRFLEYEREEKTNTSRVY